MRSGLSAGNFSLEHFAGFHMVLVGLILKVLSDLVELLDNCEEFSLYHHAARFSSQEIVC